MKHKKRTFFIKVKIKSEIYDRVYGIDDFKNVLQIFNDINGDQIKVEIIEVEVVKV